MFRDGSTTKRDSSLTNIRGYRILMDVVDNIIEVTDRWPYSPISYRFYRKVAEVVLLSEQELVNNAVVDLQVVQLIVEAKIE